MTTTFGTMPSEVMLVKSVSTSNGNFAVTAPLYVLATSDGAGGWTPNVQLFSQSRGKLRWDAAADAFLPGESPENQASAGACNPRKSEPRNGFV